MRRGRSDAVARPGGRAQRQGVGAAPRKCGQTLVRPQRARVRPGEWVCVCHDVRLLSPAGAHSPVFLQGRGAVVSGDPSLAPRVPSAPTETPPVCAASRTKNSVWLAGCSPPNPTPPKRAFRTTSLAAPMDDPAVRPLRDALVQTLSTNPVSERIWCACGVLRACVAVRLRPHARDARTLARLPGVSGAMHSRRRAPGQALPTLSHSFTHTPPPRAHTIPGGDQAGGGRAEAGRVPAGLRICAAQGKRER